MTPKPDPLPLDLAHLDDLRERIVQADEAIVSFVCLRVQLAREEVAYRRERGLPERDKVFDARERINLCYGLMRHNNPIDQYYAERFSEYFVAHVHEQSGAVDDGRYDPATGDLGF